MRSNTPIRLAVVVCLAMAAGVVVMRGGVAAPPPAMQVHDGGAVDGPGASRADLVVTAAAAPVVATSRDVVAAPTTVRLAAAPAGGTFLVSRGASANFDVELTAALVACHPQLGAPLPPCAEREAVQLVQLGRVPFAVIAGDLTARDRHAGLRATPLAAGDGGELRLVSSGRPSGAAADFVAFATSPVGRLLLARPRHAGGSAPEPRAQSSVSRVGTPPT